MKRPYALAAVALCLLACSGGPKKKPMSPDTADTSSQSDGGDDFGNAFSETSDGGGAPATGGGDTASAGDATGGGGGGGGAAPAAAAEPADECTPVGVDYEKRARPKLKECYRKGKKKDKNLQGTVKISVDIDTLGKMKSPKIVENTLNDAVGKCMLKVVKSTPMPEAKKCPGKSITIPVTFPTPK